MLPTAAGQSIVDSGCGTGYYLTELLARRDDWRALALDVSVDAVAMAVRSAGAQTAGVAADVWRALPVRDDSADVVLCVFAPRNAAEFARLLRPHGRLVVVTPAENHLVQLRESGRVIGMQSDKLAHLDDALSDLFAVDDRRRLEYDVDLLPHAVRSLAGMGPSGHHGTAETPSDAGSARVTVAVDVSSYRRV
ncbi:23S rRNA (guanine745-N1)-methyltransferase [Conyzicola nivalis]|uniref:23S rRNA (Guanine745-N1)-methyltransferase n=1 Tax=Conyzicola nivalis TaxID=1477021 RepID=A0ABV2QJC3_9MICO